MLTFLESYYQTRLTYAELIWSSIHTLSQSYYQTIVNTFWEFEWLLELTESSQTGNSKVKWEKLAYMLMKLIILPSTILDFTWVVSNGFMEENGLVALLPEKKLVSATPSP